MNTVGDFWFDKKSNLGNIEINNKPFQILHIDVDKWDEKNFRPHRHYAVRVANDFNVSNKFTISVKTLKGLVGKIKRHPYKLVKPD